MYCIQLGTLKWYYETAYEAWNLNKALEVRKSFSVPIQGVVTGIKSYDDFVQYLDAGETLQLHALKVFKVPDCEV